MQALVVDDSAAMRRVQQRALEALGWYVEAAKDGADALAKLHAMSACDLVLTDWHMPGMDGIELIKSIRQDTRYQKLRVVMVTSDAVLDAIEQALAAGANDFVMKPFTTEALTERIAEVMRV